MKIGILGGGQLSRMLALAGIPMGLEFHFFEPAESCCAAVLGQHHSASYDDFNALEAFAKSVDVITYENENIPLATLNFLEQHKPVQPNKEILAVSQDRLLEKQCFKSMKMDTPAFFEVNCKEELLAALAVQGCPAILKKRSGGYDGKGQIFIQRTQDAEQLSDQDCRHSILEQCLDFDREFSLIAARNARGETKFYDLCENLHKKGILCRTINKKDDPMFHQARDAVDRLLKHFQYVGILAVEFFQKGQQIYANEMAPRVHNSGHWTMDGAMTSQFENHLRCLLNWTPGKTDSVSYTTMYNLIGQIPDKNEVMKFADVHLHDYGKAARPGRKLGHLNQLSAHSHAYCRALENLIGFRTC